jgi:hypothetical protein
MPDATMLTEHGPRTISDREQLHGRISGIAWGLLFLWVGIALLANLGWGVGLVGAGVIVLGAQAARRFIVELPFEGFSVIVGFVFLVGGAWKLVYGQVDLVPIVCLVAGAALIVGAFTTKPSH